MTRWMKILIAITLGAGLGLLYGWLISPIKYVNTTPDALHMQYKTDYVLMTAEVFSADQNLEAAVYRLGALGNSAPSDIVYQALVFAQKAGYADADLQLMQNLLNAVQVLDFLQETPQP